MWKAFVTMDKKEYLKNKFKKDFLQYSLLQEDSLSAKGIAEKLYKTIDFNQLLAQGKREIDILCDKYLSFETVKVNGKLTNELPQCLNEEVKGKIIAEYQCYLDGCCTERVPEEMLKGVVKGIEQQAWSNGISNMQQAVCLFIERLKSVSQEYDALYSQPISEEELAEKFKQAKEKTFLERIQKNNVNDIIEYRNALVEYVKVNCQNMLYEKLNNIYHDVVNSAIWKHLQDNFAALSEYASTLKTSIVDCEINEDWDKEYNRLIPTDFYYRNVENITAEHAFKMVLFQFFARNENWMVENGMLVDGELRVYTGEASRNMKLLLSQIEL